MGWEGEGRSASFIQHGSDGAGGGLLGISYSSRRYVALLDMASAWDWCECEISDLMMMEGREGA